jgi:hypothetical protein
MNAGGRSWIYRLGLPLSVSVGVLYAAEAAAQTAGIAWTATPMAMTDPAPAPGGGAAGTAPPVEVNGLDSYFDNFFANAAAARAEQPGWSSPLITTTSMLENRVRVDVSQQTAGNGQNITTLDGGKGVDLIVGPSQEIQVAAAPYIIKGDTTKGTGSLAGWNDWPIFRFKQRLLSSPADQGNYVLSAWVQLQIPTGQGRLTSHALTVVPTLGGGKGWGDFDIQATVGASLPTAHVDKIGDSVVGNVAFQYRVFRVLWPQVEFSWNYYADGPRGGLSQLYVTPGLVVGRLALGRRLNATFGVGYESALTPSYRAKPLTPSFNHGVVATTRISF